MRLVVFVSIVVNGYNSTGYFSILRRVLNADGQMRVVRVFTANEDIFRGFGLDAMPEQAPRQPYCGFRVQLELSMVNVLC